MPSPLFFYLKPNFSRNTLLNIVIEHRLKFIIFCNCTMRNKKSVAYGVNNWNEI